MLIALYLELEVRLFAYPSYLGYWQLKGTNNFLTRNFVKLEGNHLRYGLMPSVERRVVDWGSLLSLISLTTLFYFTLFLHALIHIVACLP
jgi:hypothetical protein